MVDECTRDKFFLENISRLQEQDNCIDFVKNILFGDFSDKLTNCIFRGECPNYDTQMIVMTVCYAYCLLKFPILLMVFFYQKNRVDKISQSTADISNYDRNLSPGDQSQQQNSENNQNGQTKTQGFKYMLDKDSIEELKTYEASIMLNIYVEICMSFRDFFMFRGLGYFISYLYQVNFVYNVVTGTDTSYKCSVTKCSDIIDVSFYISSSDMCVNRFPFFANTNDQQENAQRVIMYTYIIIWIILECFASSILFFNTQVLSYVNEGGKEPKSYNNTIKKYSIAFFFGQVAVMCVLIFVFRIRLYFRFQSVEVLIYYLVWKSLGFMLLLDQFNKKNYLSRKLYIDIAYDKSVNWKQNEQDKYDEALSNSEEAAKDKKLDTFYQEEYKKCLDQLHKEFAIECEKKTDQQTKKINFQWNSYLNFVLITLICGIIGYSLCLIHYAINQESSVSQLPQSISLLELNTSSLQFGKYLNAQAVFWVGFIFCMLESAVFEIFNSVLLLHSYYLQLFEQIAQPDSTDEQQKSSTGHSQVEQNAPAPQ